MKIYNQLFQKMKTIYLVRKGLPPRLTPMINYLVSGRAESCAESAADAAEKRRSEIAASGGNVPVLYSPKPGTCGKDAGIEARPQPGRALQFSAQRVAATGKDRRWGTSLYLLARGFNASVVFELGACAGISAMYLASVPGVKKLITVEGSKALADIARESLKNHENAVVINALFDDALNDAPRGIDFAFVDGHHEMVATIHYFNRLVPCLVPGAVVVFDDVSWSRDMRAAWDTLSRRKEFSHAIDLGVMGICIVKSERESPLSAPAYWDLQPIVGRCPIGNPQGWKE